MASSLSWYGYLSEQATFPNTCKYCSTTIWKPMPCYHLGLEKRWWMAAALQQPPRSIQILIELLLVILAKLQKITLSHFPDFPAPQQEERAMQKLICQPGHLDKCYYFLQVKEEVQALLQDTGNLLRIDDLEPTEACYCRNDSGSNHHNIPINSTEKALIQTDFSPPKVTLQSKP